MIETQGSRLGGDPASLDARGAWRWFVMLGIALMLLGAIASANLFITTVAATFYVGAIMLVAGVFQIIHAFGVRQWTRFAFWLLGGLLYLGAGVAMFLDPLFAASLLTLFLAVSLALSGTLRLIIAVTTHAPSGWGWMVASSLASIAAALVIALGWPVNSIWVLGLVLSIDLLFQGVALLVIGLSLRAATLEPRTSGRRQGQG